MRFFVSDFWINSTDEISAKLFQVLLIRYPPLEINLVILKKFVTETKKVAKRSWSQLGTADVKD